MSTEPTDADISAAKGLTRAALAFLDGGPLPFQVTESRPGDPEPIYIGLAADTWINTGWWHSGAREPSTFLGSTS